jgi:hypothetical protein
MGSKEQKWVIKANLVGPFAIHWIVPQGDLLEKFLRT